MTGLDITRSFLELARADAAARGIDVEYVEGDMRALPWTGRFDAIVSWFTSFGYHDDEESRRVLAECFRALRPGGTLLIELIHRDWLVRELLLESVTERDSDSMIDRHRFDVLTGRLHCERTVVRGGSARRFEYSVRLFSLTSLRDWLLSAGFAAVDAHGDGGGPLSLESGRLIVVARK